MKNQKQSDLEFTPTEFSAVGVPTDYLMLQADEHFKGMAQSYPQSDSGFDPNLRNERARKLFDYICFLVSPEYVSIPNRELVGHSIKSALLSHPSKVAISVADKVNDSPLLPLFIGYENHGTKRYPDWTYLILPAPFEAKQPASSFVGKQVQLDLPPGKCWMQVEFFKERKELRTDHIEKFEVGGKIIESSHPSLVGKGIISDRYMICAVRN